mmetsp:Transcript_12442/g.19162  ORF Transcript_12442/g.19162 Transcript_12442/m.19162 type:complete len:309 (-) Transcript_12442:121-1047(-)
MFISGGGCRARLSYRSMHRIVLFSNSTKRSYFLRKQSSSSTVATTATNTATQIIQRHGPGDKVITLDVGGKKFQTLRSTISQNKVLYDHVLRAESNLEYAGDAVFIDRDPKHFDVILAYLRNRADGFLVGSSDAAATTSSMLRLGQNQSNSSPSPPSPFQFTSTIQLPSDSKLLSEMYIESIHYQIPEMQDLICSRQVLTRIFNLFGSNNPFQLAGSAYVNMKRLLVLFGGVMTGAGSWVYAQAVAAEAKTNELLLTSGGGGTHVSKDAVEYWKNQSQLWSEAAKKWSSMMKDEKDDNGMEGKGQGKK